MTIIKNLIVAFSLYSKIPMPIFEWKEKDMKHNIVFLPLVGLVIAGLSYGGYKLMELVNAPYLFKISVLAIIPILVSGGFHIDGFMDVEDALSSYADKERKLEILKDPHIGAFAVIHFAVLSLVWIMSLSVMEMESSIDFVKIYAAGFVIARAVGGALSLRLKKAKSDGMLNMETRSATKTDFIILLMEALGGVIFVAFVSIWALIILLVDILLFTLFYRRMAYKNFGGITGDLIGFSIVTLEAVIYLTIAVACLCI